MKMQEIGCHLLKTRVKKNAVLRGTENGTKPIYVINIYDHIINAHFFIIFIYFGYKIIKLL